MFNLAEDNFRLKQHDEAVDPLDTQRIRLGPTEIYNSLV